MVQCTSYVHGMQRLLVGVGLVYFKYLPLLLSSKLRMLFLVLDCNLRHAADLVSSNLCSSLQKGRQTRRETSLRGYYCAKYHLGFLYCLQIRDPGRTFSGRELVFVRLSHLKALGKDRIICNRSFLRRFVLGHTQIQENRHWWGKEKGLSWLTQIPSEQLLEELCVSAFPRIYRFWLANWPFCDCKALLLDDAWKRLLLYNYASYVCIREYCTSLCDILRRWNHE